MWWDIMLHALSGMNLSFMGFVILFLFISANKINVSPILITLYSLYFSVHWELFEKSTSTAWTMRLA